ncbi:MAG: hypothetical protein J6386_08180 [Candidatus Synoicihabitans palmerolidicus]|nr:hypothetical protein [Candidatus Synoicihabitans palmerolidicus]
MSLQHVEIGGDAGFAFGFVFFEEFRGDVEAELAELELAAREGEIEIGGFDVEAGGFEIKSGAFGSQASAKNGSFVDVGSEAFEEGLSDGE